MNLVLPEGARKLVGGEEGMQSKGHICTCPVLLHCFSDICQQVLGLFFMQHVIYSQVYVVMNGSVWLGGGGGGGQLLPEGWHFICHGGGWGGGQLAPTPKAMLDPGLHGTYLDLS